MLQLAEIPPKNPGNSSQKLQEKDKREKTRLMAAQLTNI
jgi:hypothetical protein